MNASICRYIHQLLRCLLVITLFGCASKQIRTQVKIGRSISRTWIEPGSLYFYNFPRKEHVFVKYPCLRRTKTFTQFATQYQEYNLQAPLKRPFTSVLGVEPVCELEPCTGLYYWYNLQIHQAKWRGSPVFRHSLFILQGGVVQFLTTDSLQNFRLIQKYKGLPLYDSLLQHSDLLVKGEISVAY